MVRPAARESARNAHETPAPHQPRPLLPAPPLAGLECAPLPETVHDPLVVDVPVRFMTTNDKYILNEQGEPVNESDLMKWAAWLENGDCRRVANDQVGKATVSTVFIGLDHAYGDDEPPILWETMVFGGPMDEEQERCSGGRADALAMHARIVEMVKKAQS